MADPQIDGALIERAFAGGTLPLPSGGEATVVPVRITQLKVTSGRIVACDPLVEPEYPPFTTTVAPGEYPVILAVAKIEGDQRVAFAKVQLREAPVARWTHATLPGQAPSKLAAGEAYGYGVDAGTGCFMDADAGHAYAARRVQEGEDEDALLGEMEKSTVETWSWGQLAFPEANGANVVAFSSGWGDGFYSTFLGLGADEQPVCFVTEFDVFDALPRTPLAPGEPRTKRWWEFWK